MGFGETSHQPRYRVPTSGGFTLRPSREGLLAQQEELLKAGRMNDFWVDAPFFFRHVLFFFLEGGGGRWWKSAIFFLYRWGFKVGNTPPFDPFGRIEILFQFFFSDGLEVTWPSLMRILGDAIFGAHENSPKRWGAVDASGFSHETSDLWVVIHHPIKPCAVAKTQKLLTFGLVISFLLRGTDCWTSWNWSTFAGRAFCGILPGAKSVGRLWRCRFGAQEATKPRGDWLLWFLGTVANTAKMPCLTLRTRML